MINHKMSHVCSGQCNGLFPTIKVREMSPITRRSRRNATDYDCDRSCERRSDHTGAVRLPLSAAFSIARDDAMNRDRIFEAWCPLLRSNK
jgi:hypothetical protein